VGGWEKREEVDEPCRNTNFSCTCFFRAADLDAGRGAMEENSTTSQSEDGEVCG